MAAGSAANTTQDQQFTGPVWSTGLVKFASTCSSISFSFSPSLTRLSLCAIDIHIVIIKAERLGGRIFPQRCSTRQQSDRAAFEVPAAMVSICSFQLCMLALFACAGRRAVVAADAEDVRHIVMLVIDDLGFADLSYKKSVSAALRRNRNGLPGNESPACAFPWASRQWVSGMCLSMTQQLMRTARLQMYDGTAPPPTPHIDQLALSGVRLESYYVNQLCSPTRTALLSGRYA